MDNKVSVETLAKIMQLAERIKTIYASSLRDEGNVSVKPDNLSILGNTLQIVSEYLPNMRVNSINEAIKKSNHYGNAYREIKKHIRELKGQRSDLNNILKTVKVVLPVMDNRQKIYFEKIIKVIEIINS